MDSWYATKGGKYKDGLGMIRSYVTDSGIAGANSKLEGSKVTMSVDGIGSFTVDMEGKTGSDIEKEINEELRKMHEAAVSGKAMEGASSPSGGASQFNP